MLQDPDSSSPQAHAALVLQAAQNHQNTKGHCPVSAPAGTATNSHSTEQKSPRLPVCCGMISLDKATKAASFQLDFFPNENSHELHTNPISYEP